MFLSRTQVIVALAAVGLALFVLDLVRRRKLSEEYSLLWVLATVVVAVLGFSTPLLRTITRALGILYEGSTVFAVGLAFATAGLLYLSVKMSRISFENHALTREVAFLRLAVQELRGDAAAARDRGNA
ncbi:MAG: DUF2304 domain-containing protein [Candidatus Eisenbacteria bacterium]|uniref:DUF2304 domain-containing protein n=1 Tax=Eiseniibacteriota bacterium TaxID=2212470 RepID=A0A849SPG1_UNCEI|nr:DUF2304 domain-containing protein [Candidatus Eisenbacteria bacterium]